MKDPKTTEEDKPKPVDTDDIWATDGVAFYHLEHGIVTELIDNNTFPNEDTESGQL